MRLRIQDKLGAARTYSGVRNRAAGMFCPRRLVATCCRPNSSKWLIRKVLVRTTVQPTNDKTVTDVARLGLAICHTTVGIGRHCHNNSARVKLANSTYVVRSTETGTNWVHQRLNSLRAMTLC